MVTTYSEIICDYFMVQQEDTRLQDELNENPAAFFRKMALYMKNAIPLFNRPPEAQQWLSRTEEPDYTDWETVTENLLESGTVLYTGKTGYELCSVGAMTTDDVGMPSYQRVSADYDPETGNVTLQEIVEAGVKVTCDFYSDGEFEYVLSEEMKNILGMCVQYVWERRFNNDYLTRVPKVKDDSFNIGNESNWIAKGTERLRVMYAQMNSALRSFEQGLAAMETLPVSAKYKNPLA